MLNQEAGWCGACDSRHLASYIPEISADLTSLVHSASVITTVTRNAFLKMTVKTSVNTLEQNPNHPKMLRPCYWQYPACFLGWSESFSLNVDWICPKVAPECSYHRHLNLTSEVRGFLASLPPHATNSQSPLSSRLRMTITIHLQIYSWLWFSHIFPDCV